MLPPGSPFSTAAATRPQQPAEGGGCVGKFIDKKVCSVRWQRGGSDSGTGDGSRKIFLTGSWEDESNCLQLWTWDSLSPASEPQNLAKLEHSGDVNEIEFVSSDIFCTASSDGSVRLFDMCSSAGRMTERKEWKNLHRGPGHHCRQSCNGVATFGDRLVSIGEDGRMIVLSATKATDPSRIYDDADSCSMTSIGFIKHDEVIVSNMRGQLNLFDLRSTENRPTTSYMSLGNEHVGVICTSRHPTQAHIVCSGSQDGALTFWDLRQEKNAMTVLKGHEQAVNEIKFHPTQPSHIFSCSENGDVWHWNGDATRSSFRNNVGPSKLGSSESFWFMNEAIRHRVQTSSVMPRQMLPMNSLDIIDKSVIVGGDNEAFYIIYNALL